MATKEEFAQLSLFVYNVNVDANQANRPLLPDGWELAEPLHPDNALGFSYGVFRKTGTTEIVLAYAGTNQDIDWLANISNGIGLSSTQATQAAMAYLQAKELYGSNISLTGHSLGGGLASVMAVWFDRPATVFDEAPFELTARNPAFTAITKAALALAGYSDPAFTAYTGLLDFYAREAKVTNYYASEEALQLARMLWPTVVGTDNRVEFGVDNMLTRRVDLHSQALLTAGLMSDSFRQATVTVQGTLPILMDKNFYAYDAATSNQQNVLINFIRSEQGTGDKLTHFASDLNKLGANIAGLNKQAQDALIAQGIEWYYWQGTDYAGQEFFTQTGNLLQYTTAKGDGLAGAQNKALSYVTPWLDSYLNQGAVQNSSLIPVRPNYGAYDQWNVVAGSSGVTATALVASKSQIFIGGSGADDFTGGQMNDLMIAGDGADRLTGGAGEDTLVGGKGSDTLTGGTGNDLYVFNTGDGPDTIVDDGANRIMYNGKVIAGLAIKDASTGQYKFVDDAGKTLQFNSPGVLTLDSTTQITFQNQSSAEALDGSFGIQLYEETTVSTTFTRTIVGDLAPVDSNLAEAGVQTRSDELGNVIVDPNQPEPDRSDYLQDSIGNDTLFAWRGGDDRLDGGAGDDIVLGRDGDDIVIGGEGMDLLRGDAGDDKIYAGSEVTLEVALAAQDANGSGLKGDFINGSGDDIFGGMGTNELQNGMSDGVSSSKWRWPDAWSLVRLHSIPNRARKIRTPQDRLAEYVCCQFKSRIRGQRSCRTRKAAAKSHVPSHASPFPGTSSNEVLQ